MKNLPDQQILEMAIKAGLKDAICAHGPINRNLIGSAIKRILGHYNGINNHSQKKAAVKSQKQDLKRAAFLKFE